MGIATGLGFFIQVGTQLALIKSLIVGTAIASLAVGIFYYKLHGIYQLQKHRINMLGDLRSSKMQKKLIGFCIGFIVLMAVPVIGTLLTQNAASNRDTIVGFTLAFLFEIVLGIGAHLAANFHDMSDETTTTSSNQTISHIHSAPQLNLYQERQVVIPIVAFFRDSVKAWIMLGQSLAMIVVVFVPMLVIYTGSASRFSLESQGYWNSASMEAGYFKFQHTII